MSKERPILFNADMVRALLDGRKTQTRRVVKQPKKWAGKYDHFCPETLAHESEGWWWDGVHDRVGASHKCPYGKPGDRLWIKETWRPEIAHSCAMDACDCADVFVRYAAGGAGQPFFDRDIPDEWLMPKAADRRNVSPLFMPRWASRITLEIVSVRVERLKSISETDASAEGVRFTDFGTFTPKGAASPDSGETWHPFKPVQHSGYHVGDVSKPSECHSSARGAFAGLWAAINGADSWNANPWVWVVEFKQVEASQ